MAMIYYGGQWITIDQYMIAIATGDTPELKSTLELTGESITSLLDEYFGNSDWRTNANVSLSGSQIIGAIDAVLGEGWKTDTDTTLSNAEVVTAINTVLGNTNWQEKLTANEVVTLLNGLLGTGWQTDTDTQLSDSEVVTAINNLLGTGWQTDTDTDTVLTNAEVVAAVDAYLGNTDWRDNPSSMTGAQVESLLDTYYGNTDWRTGSGPSLSANLTINKAIADTFATTFAAADAAGNCQGNDVIINLGGAEAETITHNLGAATNNLQVPFNGKVRIESAYALGARGTDQRSILLLDQASGRLNFQSDVDVDFNFLVIRATSNTNQTPLSFTKRQKIKFYRCFIDMENLPTEISLGDGGLQVIFIQCVFRGSASAITNLWNNADVRVYDCIILTTIFTNGLKGFGTILISNSDGCFTNPVEANSSGVELNEAQPSVPADVPAVTAGTTSATDNTISVPLTANRTGTLYGRLYLASATPTASEVAAGTGAIETQSAVAAADIEETLVFSDAAIAASTAYRVFYWLEGFAPSIEVKNLTQSTSAAPLSQLNAPVLSLSSVNDGQVTLSITDNNTSPNEGGRQLEYKLATEPTVWTTGTLAATNALTVTQAGLTNGQLYDFRLIDKGVALESLDSDPSNTIQATPAVPSGLTVTTQAVDNIADVSARGHGTITDLGANPITGHGVVFGTNPNPTLSDSVVPLGVATTTNPFTCNMNGLTPETTYYVRAYATTVEEGTVYGNEVSFTTQAEIIPVDLNAPVLSLIDNITSSSFEVHFSDPNAAPDNEEYLVVGIDTVNTFDSGSGMERWYLPADSTSIVVSDSDSQFTLVPGTTYYVRVMARHDDAQWNNSPWSNILSVTLL